MENVPLEAWNEDGVKLILGDKCIFDRLDSHSASRESRDSSQFLTCWVWMESPDLLPKAMEYWYFAAKAGQAMEIFDLPSPTLIPSTPPVGKFGDKVILIHLVGYEDWMPRSPGTSSSGTSSENGSSAPTFVPFDWAAGVLDGRPAQARPPRTGACRAPATQLSRHDRDPDSTATMIFHETQGCGSYSRAAHRTARCACSPARRIPTAGLRGRRRWR